MYIKIKRFSFYFKGKKVFFFFKKLENKKKIYIIKEINELIKRL